MNPTLTTPGTVYLLHYERVIGNSGCPRGQAQHYLGFATNLKKRISQHERGKSGAGIVSAFHRAGITFKVARTWDGDRSLENHLKRSYKSARQLCPICRELARQQKETKK